MKRTLVSLLTIVCFTAMNVSALDLGSDVPEAELLDHMGESVRLSETSQSDWTLVYFYPKADTPGCTKQACSLRDSYARLTDLGVQVYGVSRDKVADQKAFAEKFDLPFPLLSDADGALMSAFGVQPIPGRELPSRQAFLFKTGKLVWKDETASTEQQANDVIQVITETSEKN